MEILYLLMKIKERSWRVLWGIARMYSAIHDTLFGSSAYDMLDGLHRKQISVNTELSGEVGRLRHQNAQLSGRLEQRISELKTLEARQGVLNNLLAVIRRDINETLEVAHEVRTSREAMKVRAKANAGANTALTQWQKAYAGPLELRLKLAKQEVDALRGVAFSTAIDLNLKRDPKIGEIPFAYYDFVSHGFCYTPATLKFLGACEEKDALTLNQLINYIRKEDRVEIVASLKSGKGLRHYKALTSGENPKGLILTTKPFVYDKKPVGVAIFLFDPKYSVKNLRDHLVYRRVYKLFRQMFSEFESLRENLKTGKLEVSF